MIPKIVTSSQLRKNLAAFLALAGSQIVVVTDKSSNKVIMDETHYNQLLALANQFELEDPEGNYRPKFEKEILKRSKKPEYNDSISSLSELI